MVNFQIYHYKSVLNMNIYRLKFNNYLNVIFEKENDNTKKFIPVEILDISIDNIYNAKYELINYYFHKMNKNKYKIINYKNSVYVNKENYDIFKSMNIIKSNIYTIGRIYVF
jgi:hypothetical protein